MSGAGTVADLGEPGLVERILGGLAVAAGKEPGLRQGPGDDAAVLSGEGEADWVVTTDAQHEGVHFRSDWIDPATLGRRLLAVNVSDVVAMGGRPAWALLALSLPGATPLAFLDGLVEGLREGGREFECTVVGGDVARVPDRLGLCLTALGRLAGEPLRRSGARPGDGCWITGRPGRAGAGRQLLEQGRRLTGNGFGVEPGQERHGRDRGMDGGRDRGGENQGAEIRTCLEAFLRPRPPLAFGPRLAVTGLAKAVIDVSDGVAMDAGRICRASGTGLLLDGSALGEDPVLRRVATDLGEGGVDAVELVLRGGEDYQLLCAVRPGEGEAFAALADECRVTARRVGRFTEPGDGLRLRRDGRVDVLEPAGWDHFARFDAASEPDS